MSVFAGSRDSHLALWRVVDDDSDSDSVVSPRSVAGCQSYSHWAAGLHSATSDDDDDDDDDMRDGGLLLWDDTKSSRESVMTATARHRHRGARPLHLPSYYHMKPICVKHCDKAEKVRAFAYNDMRQVTVVIDVIMIN